MTRSIENLLKIPLLTLIVFITFIFNFNVKPAYAQAANCSPGSCSDGKMCVCEVISTGITVCYYSPSNACGGGKGSEVIGSIVWPDSIRQWSLKGGFSEIGLIAFLSVVVQLVAILGGIMSVINVVWAGLIYVTTAASSSDSAELVKEKLTYSFMGMAIIVFSYTIAGLIGLIFFGDAGFILSPQLEGVTDANKAKLAFNHIISQVKQMHI